MTLYGWDASHYDGPLTRAILARAKAEGIGFFSHKIGEGLADTEGTHDDTALAAARDAGIEFIGGYLVPRTGNVAAQVDYLLGLADQGEPWWHTFPGWFWQVDLERWPYDNVSAQTGIDFARRLRDKTQRQVILYASHGQYAGELTGWDGPLWNADYASRPVAGAVAMYPGDGWQPQHGTWTGGWTPYSGKTPTILQYTSSATIAGLTTCDANAYRGTTEQFRALIGGHDMALTPEQELLLRAQTGNAEHYLQAIFGLADQATLISDTVHWDRMVPNALGALLKQIAADAAAVKTALAASTAANETRDKATLAAVTALTAGGTSVDTAAVVTAVAAVRDEARAQFTQLHTENAALKSALDQAEREVARLTAALAAGAQAEAAKLAG